MNIAIAIDGPAGAGKSTVAKKVAARLGFTYIDTGAMYRTVTLGCVKKGFDPVQEKEKTIAALPEFKIDLNGSSVYLNGEDVSKAIRTEEISKLTSPVSAIPEVRRYLVKAQREMALSKSVVMDGRDIGTNVLPDAQVKVFMTAKAEVRAERRCLQLIKLGKPADKEAIQKEIEQRDYNDSHRAVNPLKPADDAVLLDTSDIDIMQTVEAILKIVAEKTGVTAK